VRGGRAQVPQLWVEYPDPLSAEGS
jgi:hypothetical protein